MIDICINKSEKNVANVWLLFKLSAGEMYKLPQDQDTRTSYIDNECLFQSSGLQIRCLSPLRKWRISFNGRLQKCDETKELVHVKFSFVWLAMSLVKELASDVNSHDLALAFAKGSCNMKRQHLSNFQDFQNRYEQWGQMMGTVSIKGSEEKDLYLWSCRTRIADAPVWHTDINSSKFYMYFKEGFPLKIENLNIAELLSNFTSGYTTTGTGAIQDISHCDLNADQLNTEAVLNNICFSFVLSGIKKSVNVSFTGEKVEFHTGPQLEHKVTLQPFTVSANNGDEGFGILHLISKSKQDVAKTFKKPILLLKEAGLTSTEESVVLLSSDLCANTQITGGKGCSLGLLMNLSKHTSEFLVPKGFVITTTAFKKHVWHNPDVKLAIQRLNTAAGQKTVDLKKECLKCINAFNSSKLSPDLKNEINSVLSKLYGSYADVRFSVRSSACGEDSEDLSAAGQMLTVLGVRDLNNIVEAVINCWASKFSFEAVQYFRQNGQPITLPMAVVVQEMVPSEISGVLFTSDPVTGDPSHLCITANYGLGETVVSSLADPDTVILKRNADHSLSVFEKTIGSKKTQVHMKDGGGTEQKCLESKSTGTCLTDEMALRIGNVGILVEKCFCGPRDIEFGVHNETLFLLQARPITTLHTETDFELIHDQDSPVRSNHEYWTRANTGEVFLGATSPLAVSIVVGGMDLYSHRNQVLKESKFKTQFCPYIFHVLPITHKQVTISLVETIYRRNHKEMSSTQKAFEVALFGRLVTTKEMRDVGIKRYGYTTKLEHYLGFLFLLKLALTIPKSVKTLSEKIDKHVPDFKSFTTIQTTWQGILDQFRFYSEVSGVHGMATYISSFYNMIVMNILAKGNEFDSVLYGDFANLMSSCTKVESANVPESLQGLAKVIATEHGKTFSSLPPNLAYQVLSNDNGNSGKLFKDFLKKHGHRCVKEFDLYSVSWGMKPESLIPIIQNIVNSPNVLNIHKKEELSVESAISRLKTPLSTSSKFLLKIFLPRSRDGVGHRERTKSMLIKTVDWFRQSFYHLGELMVQGGMLPDHELVFFLTMEEIKDMLESRRLGLVPKAIRRRRLHPKLNALQFPEIIKGIPKPIKANGNEKKYDASFTLKGTPVCHGKVKARAIVVLSLDEASNIKNGDILITHSTDIGWSPYFPLLSGVVTVLGGLISHGAVVAREYGLPCVVGVQNATSAFKTGDMVILDGTNGTVTKVLSDEDSKTK